MSLDFEALFLQADNLRNDARADEAIKAYLDIVKLASAESERAFRARAYHLSGVAAKESVIDKSSSYYRDALGYYEQAEEIFRQLGDEVELGNLYRDVATTADYAGDYANALVYFQKSVEILKKTEEIAALAITYDKMGLHFAKIGQIQEGLQWIEKAEKTLRRGSEYGYYGATIALDKARLQAKLSHYDEAQKSAEESLGWFEADHGQNTYKRRCAQLYGLLAIISNQLSDLRESEKYYLQYQALLRDFNPLSAKVIKADLQELS